MCGNISVRRCRKAADGSKLDRYEDFSEQNGSQSSIEQANRIIRNFLHLFFKSICDEVWPIPKKEKQWAIGREPIGNMTLKVL
jgi:hypothetical protein